MLSSLLTNQIFILTEKNRTFKEKSGGGESVSYELSAAVRVALPPPGLADKMTRPFSKEDSSNLDILKDNLYS